MRRGLAFLHAHAQPQGGYATGSAFDWHEGWPRAGRHHHCYGNLAFVLLAHAHALMAGVEEARNAGLDATFALMEQHFWEPANGPYADEATPDWRLSAYRGQNANMHACEANLAAFDATREPIPAARADAGRIW